VRWRPGGKVVLSTGITKIELADAGREAFMSSSADDFARFSRTHHLPVMAEQIVRGLAVVDRGVYLDGTLGEGGHSLAILESGPVESSAADSSDGGSSGGAALVIGIDLDGRSVAAAAQRLSGFGPRFLALQGNYTDMVSIAEEQGIGEVDGVLLDLGFSSRQVDQLGYGLSFLGDEPLDMRYDAGQELDAANLVNSASESELAMIFQRFGEEPRGRAIARTIVRERANHRITTTAELASLVERTAGRRTGHRLHPATRVFQALRIAVNGELDNVQAGLEAAVALLRSGGRLAVISYHSLEDRLVKNFMTHQSAVCVCPRGLPVCVCGQEPTLAIVNRRIIRPSGEEVAFNPRSRSARLRLARRI
jgi:16S rRNA (cytosine1402-N4)-methyltransferase